MKTVLSRIALFLGGCIVGVLVFLLPINRRSLLLKSEASYVNTFSEDEGQRQLDRLAAGRGGVAGAPKPAKPDWQIHIDWAFIDTGAGGSVYCVDQYIGEGQIGCLISGGRSCMINGAAVELRKKVPDFNAAKNLIYTTQCHSDSGNASVRAVNDRILFDYVQNHK